MSSFDTTARPRFGLRRTVVDQARGNVVIEQGDVAKVPGNRVAVCAHFSLSPQVSRSFDALIHAFDAAGYSVIVVSTSPMTARLDWHRPLPEHAVVLRRPNIGYDFGSWATALDMVPAIAARDRVVFANDSLAGPFYDPSSLFRKLEATTADVWGMTSSYEVEFHLQSYFLGFRHGVLMAPPLGTFWRSIRVQRGRGQVINRYELGLSRLAKRAGLLLDAAIDGDSIVARGHNPVTRGWAKLLDAGFPFVKRELIRDRPLAPDSHLIEQKVEQMYGEQLQDWL